MGLLGKSCAFRVAEKRQNIVTNKDLDSKEIFFILQLLFQDFQKELHNFQNKTNFKPIAFHVAYS